MVSCLTDLENYMMKLLIYLFFILSTLATCKNPAPNEERLRTENFILRQQIDSLKNLIRKTDQPTESDTILKLPEDKPSIDGDSFAGKHSLTLQWISWDEPGSVLIVPALNGWYTISGKQANRENYVKINGRIRPLSEQELEFEGEIETLIKTINNGKPCLKTGKKIFLATGSRQYWRLQDMANCEGNNTIDYIDIYF